MKRHEFAKLVSDALEVSAQAHPVRLDEDRSWQTVIHALDKDQVLWRIVIEEPR